MPVTINGTTGITSPNKVLIGTSNSGLGITTGDGNLQVVNNGSNQFWMPRYSNDAFGSAIQLAKSRGTSIGSDVAVQVGDDLGYIEFRGWTGAAYPSSAVIQADVGAGTVSTTSLPSELRFFTTPDGSISNTERFRIAPSGQIGIGGANYGTSGQVLTSGGASAAPSWANTSSMVLLGTVATTSGTTQSLAGLDLTSYKVLYIVGIGVSLSGAGYVNFGPSNVKLGYTSSAATNLNMFCSVSLENNGMFMTVSGASATDGTFGGSGATSVPGGWMGQSGLTQATTSISISASAGSFDAGSVRIYGVR